MRLFNYIFIIGALGMALSGCSSSEIGAPDASLDDTVRVPITLTIGVNHGLQVASRFDEDFDWNMPDHMPRRLLTWDGEQCIDDLRIYVFESPTKNGAYRYAGGGECIDGSYLVTSFNNAKPIRDEFEEHTFTFIPKLKRGSYYKLLAIARDDILGSLKPVGALKFVPWGTRTMSDAEFQIGVTEFHKAAIFNQLETSQFPYITTEIFSGIMYYYDNLGKKTEDYIYLGENIKGFQKTVELHRAVAGLWVNLTDIPAVAQDDESGADFIPRELIISMPYTQSELCVNGSVDNKPSNLVLNANLAYENFSNDFGEFAGNENVAQWHKSADEKFWERGSINMNGVKINPNCSMLSNFMIPIDPAQLLNSNQSTMILQLCNVQSAAKVTFNIKCVIKNVINPSTGESYPYTGDAYHYPVLPNCLYTIGTPDNPLSLSTVQKLTRSGEREIEMECVPMY